jgi:triphosphatase
MQGQEIELKLHIDAEHIDAVVKAVHGRTGATRTHLQASYLDTPKFGLAAAGMGWRLRREGRRWVQTLKAQLPGGPDGLRREEHNVVVRGPGRPQPDAALHAGTDAGDVLIKKLRKLDPAPTEQFRTDVWRETRPYRVPGGSVELAVDRGKIVAGERTLAVSELEIELLTGAPRAVINAARHWATRHHLWIDVTTKAQRGVMLAKGADVLPVAKAPMPALHRAMTVDEAVREMTRACLVQILGNTSALAAGLGGHEHVHQARVGIRKLRTTFREFGPYVPAVQPEWSTDLAEVFSVLGASRDREVVLAGWLERLESVGGPRLLTSVVEVPESAQILRTIDFTVLALDLLEFANGEAQPSELLFIDLVGEHLQNLRKGSVKQADVFTSLDIEAMHDVRKELKRLRYVAELSESLFPAKKVKAFVKAMAPAQDALGELNDLIVAVELFEEMTAADPGAWFAVGWLRSRRESTVNRCVKPLRVSAKATPYWRH